MPNLNQILKRPLQAPAVKAVLFLLVVALLGFVDAAYLTVEHFLGVVPPCSLVHGCDKVLTSQYSVILGVPVSLAGALFYLLVLAAALSFFDGKRTAFLKWALILSLPAFLVSLWFVFVQVFILHSYCVYCLGSALTSTILFVIAMKILKGRHSQIVDVDFNVKIKDQNGK